MNDVVSIEYGQMQAVGSRFRKESESVAVLYSLLVQKQGTLRSGSWIGRGSDSFNAEMVNEVLPALRRLIDALNMAGDVSDRTAELFREAEDAAAAPFDSIGGGSAPPTPGMVYTDDPVSDREESVYTPPGFPGPGGEPLPGGEAPFGTEPVFSPFDPADWQPVSGAPTIPPDVDINVPEDWLKPIFDHLRPDNGLDPDVSDIVGEIAPEDSGAGSSSGGGSGSGSGSGGGSGSGASEGAAIEASTTADPELGTGSGSGGGSGNGASSGGSGIGSRLDSPISGVGAGARFGSDRSFGSGYVAGGSSMESSDFSSRAAEGGTPPTMRYSSLHQFLGASAGQTEGGIPRVFAPIGGAGQPTGTGAATASGMSAAVLALTPLAALLGKKLREKTDS